MWRESRITMLGNQGGNWITGCCGLINKHNSKLAMFWSIRYLYFWEVFVINYSHCLLSFDPGGGGESTAFLVEYTACLLVRLGVTARWTLGLHDMRVWKLCIILESHGFFLYPQLCLLSAWTVCDWKPEKDSWQLSYWQCSHWWVGNASFYWNDTTVDSSGQISPTLASVF